MERSMSDWTDRWAADATDRESVMSVVSDSNNTPEEVRAERRRKKSTNRAFAALFVGCIVSSLLTYFLLSKSQQEDFEIAFSSYARETADIAENNAESVFGQLKVLSTAITSIAVESPDDFPFIRMPHLDLRTQEIADITGIEMMLFVPFVAQQHRASWETFQQYNQAWIVEDYEYRGWNATGMLEPIPEHIHNFSLPDDFHDTRRGFVDDNGFMEEILANLSYSSEGFSAPIAQYGPALSNTSLALLDLYSHPIFKKEMIASLEYNVPVISEIEDLQFLLEHVHPHNVTTTHDYSLLRSFTLHQVKEDFRKGARTVGYVVGIVPWATFFRNVLPQGVNGIVVKVVSDCGQVSTYDLNSDAVTGRLGDHHDSQYDHLMQQYKFFWKDHPKGVSRHCHFDLEIYPSQQFEDAYTSNAPVIYTCIVVGVFIFAAMVLCAFDSVQKNVQREVYEEKARAEAVVDSLFPKHVGKRLLAEQQLDNHTGGRRGRQQSIHEFLSQDFCLSVSKRKNKPLADLFPFATVMFADIVGFTAWSSVREPFQVFTLLEALYQAFDAIAKRRKVFKVETVGDCYVAVAGLPEPRRDHGAAMAMFAQDCMDKFYDMVEFLEVFLGPDTAELGLRIGLHSGPVTAGVLRGERARFQLFGDTVNTCSRMESTGEGGRIHISEECAEELRKFGKGCWVVPRLDKVTAKGKGTLSTCWLVTRDDDTASQCTQLTVDLKDDQEMPFPIKEKRKPSMRKAKSVLELIDEKNQRLVEWNTETLKLLLEQVIGRRIATSTFPEYFDEEATDKKLRGGRMVFDEVAEIINLPSYDQTVNHSPEDNPELDEETVGLIRAYVSRIAKLYPDNPFHNFDHASHVAMSVSKLLSRIVAPKIGHVVAGRSEELQRKIHDHTYGITSDPLTQFACVFSSLIHDCEHDGVPNAQLVKEEHRFAARYNNISVAEQNSVDVAWDILMQPKFQKLRAAIYTTEAEMIRFRQLVVNSVMATDIVDKELKTLRNARWEKAFKGGPVEEEEDADVVNRKATIVIEHLIQASDVSHTMQHWHIFHKWNENLFREMYTAYKAGRSEKDPSEFWYKGEIGFFDFYIIPLAKKLKECGVFGVSSDEYLNYAQSNRREWEQKGEAIVKSYIANFEADSHAARKEAVMKRRLTRQISKAAQSSLNMLASPSASPLSRYSTTKPNGTLRGSILDNPSLLPPLIVEDKPEDSDVFDGALLGDVAELEV